MSDHTPEQETSRTTASVGKTKRSDQVKNSASRRITLTNEPAARDAQTRALAANRQAARAGGASSLRWSARQLATMALMLAIGLILSFIEFPLLPGTEFLKFDASYVPAVMIGFSYGPGAGCVVSVLVAAIHALFSGNLWGGLMNAVIALAYILPAIIAYRLNRNTTSIIIGLVIGSIAQIVVALLMNILITPIYTGMPLPAVMGLLVFPILPFNILKALINSVLAFVLQRSLRGFLESQPRKPASQKKR